MPSSARRATFGILALLVATACAPRPKATGPVALEHETFDPMLKVNLAGSTRTPTGLYYRDITVGTGITVASGTRVAVLYTGWTVDGKPFDSAVAGQAPIEFVVGTQAVIAGWDEGLVGMRVGGSRQLIIPSNLGYGPTGNDPIPPYANLVFTVEVVAAK